MGEPITDKNPFRHILFCTDFSENADFAFTFAVDSATRRPGSTLHLLHVIPEAEAQFWRTYLYEIDDDVDAKARRDIDERIREAYLSRVPENVNVIVEIRTGKDFVEILKFSDEAHIDLIVMGRQGRSALSTVLFGNVTERVTRKARCAVLVVPLSFRERFRHDGD